MIILIAEIKLFSLIAFFSIICEWESFSCICMPTHLFISLVIFSFRHSFFLSIDYGNVRMHFQTYWQWRGIEEYYVCWGRFVISPVLFSFFFPTVQWINDQRRSSSMINRFWHIQRMKENIIFTSLFLLLLLHLHRGNQMEYILEKRDEKKRAREREEMDACRAFATTEMRWNEWMNKMCAVPINSKRDWRLT